MHLPLDKASFLLYICKVFGMYMALLPSENQQFRHMPKKEVRLCADFDVL